MCWDNAAAESFFASLKNECYHRRRHETRARARFTVAEYIEVFYNRRRLHSSLGYRPQPKPYKPTTPPQQQRPNQQKPEELSKIFDTAHSFLSFMELTSARSDQI
ncbi:hypothetical protein GCM10009676_04810 [Prauserella halophila]|uniref:Integrase catalytic domain-containing protein n=1 Tax=Prauserella halophila TaxID=185641 RepID=A0ABN1VX09_9PSEU|nr:Integrase core domain-containing protein [Prauserella halophila]